MSVTFGAASATVSIATVSEKLAKIVLPKVEFVDVTVAEAVEFLSLQSRQYDTTTPDAERKGVSIVVAGGPEFTGAKVTLDVTGIPLGEALRYIADQAGMRPVVERYAVRIVPLGSLTVVEFGSAESPPPSPIWCT